MSVIIGGARSRPDSDGNTREKWRKPRLARLKVSAYLGSTWKWLQDEKKWRICGKFGPIPPEIKNENQGLCAKKTQFPKWML